MKKSHLLWMTCIFLLAASGCSTNAKLYPLNDTAQPTGVLRAKYFTNAAGSASVTVEMPDGEVLLGHFTLLDKPQDDFGAILAAEEYTAAVAAADEPEPEDEFPGFGTFVGDRGTRMDCEFNRFSSGGGSGACLTTDGALYRLYMPR